MGTPTDIKDAVPDEEPQTKAHDVQDDEVVQGTVVNPAEEEREAISFFERVVDIGFSGPGPLGSAQELAAEYANDKRLKSYDDRVDALIQRETAMTFTSGFVTGLGGVMTMPITVPASVGAAWLFQARLIGAIAVLGGHDLQTERVRGLAMLALAGDTGKEAVKRGGIEAAKRAGHVGLRRAPVKAIYAINRVAGFRLVTKYGATGIVNLSKGIPLLGGIVGGSLDAATLRAVGRYARKEFHPDGADATTPLNARERLAARFAKGRAETDRAGSASDTDASSAGA